MKYTKVKNAIKCPGCTSTSKMYARRIRGINHYRCYGCKMEWHNTALQNTLRQEPGVCLLNFYGPWLDKERDYVQENVCKMLREKHMYKEWSLFKGRNIFTFWTISGYDVQSAEDLNELLDKMIKSCQKKSDLFVSRLYKNE